MKEPNYFLFLVCMYPSKISEFIKQAIDKCIESVSRMGVIRMKREFNIGDTATLSNSTRGKRFDNGKNEIIISDSEVTIISYWMLLWIDGAIAIHTRM